MTDEELIKGSINKNEFCQRELFETYAGKMMSVCLRYATDQHQAQDILQDGFIQVFKQLQQFRFEGSFEGWMRRIFVNIAIRKISRQQIHYSGVEEVLEQPDISANVVDKISEEEIHRLICRLPTGYRVVFNLYVIEGYSHDEIARFLGIEASTSRTQLLKARKMLQVLISKQLKMVSV